MKHHLIAIVFAAGMVGLGSAAQAAGPVYPEHTSSMGLVNDFAGVLSLDQKAALESELRSLEKDTKAEFAVVTVASLQGIEERAYAHELGNRWHIGKGGADNGVLFLIAPNDHRESIETGRRLESVFTDLECQQILLQHYHPHAVQKDVAGAIVDTTQAIEEELRTVLTPAENKEVMSHEKKASGTNVSETIVVTLGMLLLAFFAVVVGVMSMHRKKHQEEEKPSEPSFPPLPPATRSYSPRQTRPSQTTPYAPPTRREDDPVAPAIMAGAIASAVSEPGREDAPSFVPSNNYAAPEAEDTDKGFSFGGGDTDNKDDDDNLFGGGGAGGDD